MFATNELMMVVVVEVVDEMDENPLDHHLWLDLGSHVYDDSK